MNYTNSLPIAYTRGKTFTGSFCSYLEPFRLFIGAEYLEDWKKNIKYTAVMKMLSMRFRSQLYLKWSGFLPKRVRICARAFTAAYKGRA